MPKTKPKTTLRQGDVVKVGAISEALNLHMDADGIYSRRKIQSMEILYDRFLKSMESIEWPVWIRVRDCRASSSRSLIDMTKENRAGSEGSNGGFLIGCQSCCITQRHGPPTECDHHSVQPITTTVRSPLSPSHLF